MRADRLPAKQIKWFVAGLSDIPWDARQTELVRTLDPCSVMRAFVSADGRMFVAFAERVVDPSKSAPIIVADRTRLILGDSSEFIEQQSHMPMGNGAVVEFDLEKGSVRVLASITGLPPIFLYEEPGQQILTSSLSFLGSLIPFGLKLDPESVLDLCTYGFPKGYRTLFRNVRLIPGRTRLTVAVGTPAEPKRAGTVDRAAPMSDWTAYMELQIAAFLKGLNRIDLRNTFLSITAGLDTRTIFAALVQAGRSVDAYTLSGESPSLDAQTAHSVCRAYGVPHGTVLLDKDFLRMLPDYVMEASRLSGGLASLGQAHQVHFYRKLPGHYVGRLSGNMGNQLGRKGMEHVSMRAVSSSVLHQDLRRLTLDRPRFAWRDQERRGHAPSSPQFLFQHEFPFTQLGNYLIGDSFVVQHTPYATRDLIALCYREPLGPVKSQSRSPLHLRLNDLRHRFLGEPVAYSFQRRLIQRTGGFVASYPINWGWRATGGIAFAGMLRGCLAAVDAYTEREGWDTGALRSVFQAMHVTGLHEHRRSRQWIRESLRDFVQDTLLAKQAKESGVIDHSCVGRMLEEHYSDRASHHGALVFALDLVIASKNFRASL